MRIPHFAPGEGEVLQSTVGGEIAFCFCRSDGRGLDVLPALRSPAAVSRYHRQLCRQMLEAGLGETDPQFEASRRDVGRVVLSKTGISHGGEPMVVVEPGGLGYCRHRTRELPHQNPLRTPADWNETVFVEVLDPECKVGIVEYDIDSLQPLSIFEQE